MYTNTQTLTKEPPNVTLQIHAFDDNLINTAYEQKGAIDLFKILLISLNSSLMCKIQPKEPASATQEVELPRIKWVNHTHAYPLNPYYLIYLVPNALNFYFVNVLD